MTQKINQNIVINDIGLLDFCRRGLEFVELNWKDKDRGHNDLILRSGLEMAFHELGYAAGNAIKNILHFRSLKGGIEELQAAKEYIDLLINREHAYGKVALCKHCKKQMNNLHKHPKQFCSDSCRGKEYRRAGHSQGRTKEIT